MNRKAIHIAGYCSIRNCKVVADGKLLFESNEKHAAAFYTSVYQHFGINYPKFHKMDQMCKLGFLASELLLRDKKVNEVYGPYETGIVIFNASSSIDADRNHQQSISNRADYFPSPSVFVYTLANIVVGEICIRHQVFGEGISFIEEKFNASGLYSYVKNLFDEDIVKCCIIGWLESNGDHYDGILYLVEKSSNRTEGIANFEPETLFNIYSR
jgi:hypothetical protein